MSELRWLDRRAMPPLPYLLLCTTQEEFEQARQHCKTSEADRWVGQTSDASTHIWKNEHGELVTVVCLQHREDLDVAQALALLVHEAVHVSQAYFELLGELAPSREFQAYVTQAISQELMTEWLGRRGLMLS